VIIPAGVHTLDDFLRWAHSDAYPQRGNIAFVGGELLLDMSAERIGLLAKVKGEVYLALSLLTGRHLLQLAIARNRKSAVSPCG
jgi:hypothetical protein